MYKKATEEAVWQVCDLILTEGRRVSGRTVKKEIGGSTTTIYPYIDSWRARDEKSTVVCEIPVDVQKTILLALGQSAKKATETLTVKIEEAAEREKEITEELIESEQKIATLEDDLSDAQAQIISLTQMRERESAVATETIVGLREQIVKLSQEKSDLIFSREAAKTEAVKIQMQLDRADLATAKAEESLLELETQVSSLTETKTETEKANAVAGRHAQDLSGQIAKLDEQSKNIGATIIRLESEKSALTNELNGAMSAYRKAEGAAEQMALRIQDFTATNGQLRHDLEAVRAESALTAEQNALRIHEGEATINQLRKDLESVRKEATKVAYRETENG
ncbi:MAG: DNA-binding protein [Chlorobium sp.]|nr:DNA-binding protein [Chlorobium sp.]